MADGPAVPQKKEVEEKELKLRQSIAKNYSHIKSVENQLADLQLQLNLTSGPKKSALEMLRRKIEAKNELVAAARQQYAAAKQVAEQAEEVLRAHERSKEQLCQELNLLVHQSATAELNKLEQLAQQLESLNGGKLANSHQLPDRANEDTANLSKEVARQQVVANNLPSAEAAAAATTEQQARASNSTLTNAPASSSNTTANPSIGEADESAAAAVHNSHPQRAKQVLDGQSSARKNKPRSNDNRKQLTQAAGKVLPQAASDSSGRFKGFE